MVSTKYTELPLINAPGVLQFTHPQNGILKQNWAMYCNYLAIRWGFPLSRMPIIN